MYISVRRFSRTRLPRPDSDTRLAVSPTKASEQLPAKEMSAGCETQGIRVLSSGVLGPDYNKVKVQHRLKQNQNKDCLCGNPDSGRGFWFPSAILKAGALDSQGRRSSTFEVQTSIPVNWAEASCI